MPWRAFSCCGSTVCTVLWRICSKGLESFQFIHWVIFYVFSSILYDTCIKSCPVATHRLPVFALSAGGERVETCQAQGSGPMPRQLTAKSGHVYGAALLTAEIPDQVNPNHRGNRPLMWKFIFLLCVSRSKGTTCHLACLHKTLELLSATDYCNEELKSLNSKDPAPHCFSCQI